jgi:RimJ/RimL family protein N-acetyltransferase
LEAVGAIHLAVTAVLEQRTPGEVYLDDLAAPRIALARAKHRYHLGGDPSSEVGKAALRRLFSETIYPQALPNGEVLFMLFYPPEWGAQIDDLLTGKDPLLVNRQHYICRAGDPLPPLHLPEGFELRPVDGALMAQQSLENLDDLQEEMCSERISVQEFLEESFGVCAVQGNVIAGWCLSEYNTAQRCEIGIETRPAFRQRGLATALTGAFTAEGFRRGLREIGWDCFTRNVPSAATARKAGFRLASDYTSHMAWYDARINAGVHGNVHLDQGLNEGALRWFEKSIALGTPLDWVLFGAARAAARLGLGETARGYAQQAVAAGMEAQDVWENEDLRGCAPGE